jgi:ligand-binding SRPBCC domain-containing protein
MGVTLRWTTLITSYDPPRSFTDEQLRGPYSFWHHRHVFREVDDGTEILDEVHYALRGGMLAPLIHRLFVRKQLDKIFDHRARIIVRELMGTETEVGS